MINKRLVGMVPETKKYVALSVLWQVLSLICNVLFMYVVTRSLANVFTNKALNDELPLILKATTLTIFIRFMSNIVISRLSFLSSKAVKTNLRAGLYQKLLDLGYKYNEKFSLSELVQLSTEGIEQLEIYFAAYLPQLFYSMLAPVILFIVLFPIHRITAVVLLICVPIIPVAIALVQTLAKKLLSKYWNKYTKLGSSFLDNLQGLTTLKIYSSDEYKNNEMNREAEEFRKITMKVLSMQLNSITIMDLVAYGGAALGIFTALLGLKNGNISMADCFFIILISADFFIPMRQMGSLFHVAMNGMAASKKMFQIFDLDIENENEKNDFPNSSKIILDKLCFAYDDSNKEILSNLSLSFDVGSYAIVGESGSGKSTLAYILSGKNRNYKGSLKVGDIELKSIKRAGINKALAYIGHDSFLFKGTVRENLKMAAATATDDELWEVLKRVNLKAFFENENGLDTMINERASNLSGGQRQRLALARALLYDCNIYIFDEATSNIDAKSEDYIMKEAYRLSKSKLVIIISHRLANVVNADMIYVLDASSLVESGTHEELLKNKGSYAALYETQQSLEQYIG